MSCFVSFNKQPIQNNKNNPPNNFRTLTSPSTRAAYLLINILKEMNFFSILRVYNYTETTSKVVGTVTYLRPSCMLLKWYPYARNAFYRILDGSKLKTFKSSTPTAIFVSAKTFFYCDICFVQKSIKHIIF